MKRSLQLKDQDEAEDKLMPDEQDTIRILTSKAMVNPETFTQIYLNTKLAKQEPVSSDDGSPINQMKLITPVDVEFKSVRERPTKNQFQNQTLSDRLAQDDDQQLKAMQPREIFKTVDASRNPMFDIKSSEAIKQSLPTSKPISDKKTIGTPQITETHESEIIVVNPIVIQKKVTGVEKYQKVRAQSFKQTKRKPACNVNQQIIDTLRQWQGFLPNYSTPNNQGRTFNARVKHDMQQYILNDTNRRKVKSSRGNAWRGKLRKDNDVIGMTIKQWHAEKTASQRVKSALQPQKEEPPVRKELRVETSGDNINLFWVAEEKKVINPPPAKRRKTREDILTMDQSKLQSVERTPNNEMIEINVNAGKTTETTAMKPAIEDAHVYNKNSPTKRASGQQLSKSLFERYKQIAPIVASKSVEDEIKVIGSNEIVRSSPNVIVSKIYENQSACSQGSQKLHKKQDLKIVDVNEPLEVLLDLKEREIVAQSTSLQYLNESQNLPDILSQTKDSSEHTSQVGNRRKTPTRSEIFKNKIKASVYRKTRPVQKQGQSRLSKVQIAQQTQKRLKSAANCARKLNWRGVPPEAPRDERRLERLRTAAVGKLGEIQLGLPHLTHAGDGLDMAGIQFDKHLRKAFQKVAQRNQLRSKSSIARSTPKPCEILAEIQGFDLRYAFDRKASGGGEALSEGTNRINNSQTKTNSKIFNKSNRLSQILLGEDFAKSRSSMMVHPKSFDIDNPIKKGNTGQEGNPTMENAVLVFQRRPTLSQMSNGYKSIPITSHFSMGMNSQLVVQGSRVKSTLERDRSPSPHRSKLSQEEELPVNNLTELPELIQTAQKEETLKVSKASLDIVTDVVTALRSSDSEKCMAINNSISEEPINLATKESLKKSKGLSKRKKSGQVMVETSLVTELVRQPDQGMTERNLEPDRVSPFEIDMAEKALPRFLDFRKMATNRMLTFGGAHEISIMNVDRTTEVNLIDPRATFSLESDRASIITPHLHNKHPTFISNPQPTKEYTKSSEITEPLKTDSSIQNYAQMDTHSMTNSPKRGLEKVVEQNTGNNSGNISGNNSGNTGNNSREIKINFKKAETMVQTDFKDDIDETPHDLEEAPNLFDIEATKLWLLKKYESSQQVQAVQVAKSQKSQIMFIQPQKLGGVRVMKGNNRIPIPKQYIVQRKPESGVNSHGTLETARSANQPIQSPLRNQIQRRKSPTSKLSPEAVKERRFQEQMRKSQVYQQKRDLVSQRRKEMARPRQLSSDLKSRMLKLDAEHAFEMLEAEEVIRNKWEQFKEQVGPLDGKLSRRRIIHRTHTGENQVVNPSISEALCGPEMQGRLEMVGCPISEQGISQRHKAFAELYQLRRENLKYQRKRKLQVETESSDSEPNTQNNSPPKTPKKLVVPQKDYIINLETSDVYNSIQSLDESCRGQTINVFMKNPTLQQKTGVTFNQLNGQRLVNIEKGKLINRGLKVDTNRKPELGWEGIREITDVSKDHNHSRNDDLETVYLQSMIVQEPGMPQKGGFLGVKPQEGAMLGVDLPGQKAISSTSPKHPLQHKTMPISLMMNIHDFSRKKASQPDHRHKDSVFLAYRKESGGSHAQEPEQRISFSGAGYPNQMNLFQSQIASPTRDLDDMTHEGAKKRDSQLGFAAGIILQQNGPDFDIRLQPQRRITDVAQVSFTGQNLQIGLKGLRSYSNASHSSIEERRFNDGRKDSKQNTQILPSFRTTMGDDNSLKQLAPVANIQINQKKKRVSLVITDAENSTRNRDLKINDAKEQKETAKSGIVGSASVNRFARRNVFSAMKTYETQPNTITRPQTTKNAKQTHRDRKLMYLQFRRGDMQRRQQANTIDTECTSLGVNRFLSGGMTSPELNGVRRTEKRREESTSFFNVMSQQLSAAFSKDQTSMNIKSSMVRGNQSHFPQTPTINLGVIPGIRKNGRSLVRLQNAHQKEVQTINPIISPKIRHTLLKRTTPALNR